jgi:hypothetical protein
MHLNKGNRWEGERGMGRVRGVQFTANQGQEWTGIRATAQRRDFQTSKKGCQERGCGHASQCIYRANKRLCLGYK